MLQPDGAMEPSKPKKDQDLLRYLAGLDATGDTAGSSDQQADMAGTIASIETAVTTINIEDLDMSGVHPSMGVDVLEIKQEPADPEVEADPALVPPAAAAALDTADDLEDDDVIFVDRETTLKYLTGEISFEEYSAHLDVKDDPDITEEGVEVVTTVLETAAEPSTSATELGTRIESEPPKPKKAKGPRSRLPRDLLGLMGEANMRYARNNTEEAIKMCMEIIRLAPSAAEPFQTLSMIYEDQGDTTKSLQYALIAAHLKADVEEWLRVADMCLEQDQPTQTIRCYTKAIQLKPKDLSLWEKRCALYERMGERKLVLNSYQYILRLLPEEASDRYLQLSRDLAQSHHSNGDLEKAAIIMSGAFEKQPKSVSAEDVNLLLELFMAQKKFVNSVALLIQHCGVGLLYDGDVSIQRTEDGKLPDLPTDSADPVNCEAPAEIPVDLRAKLAMCLIHLGYNKCVASVADPIVHLDGNEVGDLHLDIAEVYMEKGLYRKARPVLASLVHTDNYNLAAVWLRYGECLNSMGDPHAAVRAYKQVVSLAPSHLGARVSLASIQQQLGLHEDALASLDTGCVKSPSTAPGEVELYRPQIDARLLLHKCSLLFSQKKIDGFIECAEQLLFTHVKQALNPDVRKAIFKSRSTRNRISSVKGMLGQQFELQLQAVRDMVGDGGIKLDDMWELFIKLCEVLMAEKKYQKFENATILAQILPPFYNDAELIENVEFMCLIACMKNKDGFGAYLFVRDLCLENMELNSVWNLFCQVITIAKDLRHNRFCLRLTLKNPEHHALNILNGHNALISGTYKHALGEYVAALKQDPQNPMLSLCVGITFIHLASQKYAAQRNSLIVQGCSFLNQYQELRGDCQESNYNLGRAMHQIGLLHAAVHYYNKVLALPPDIHDTEENKEVYNLSKEAAFNLSLIYQLSGSHHLACHIINQHFIV